MYNRVSTSPFTSFSKSAPSRMLCVWLALLPQIAALFVSKSYASLAVILAAVLGAALSEIQNLIKKNNVALSLSTALLTGTLTGFFLPPTYPPASVFLITFVFMFAARHIFGRPGVSWINPVVLTVAAAWFISRANFGGFLISGNDLLIKNPSLNLIDAAMLTNGVDERVTAFLNDTVFSLFGVSIPNGYVSVFWDNHAAIPAFRFSFLTLLASLYLFSADYERAEIPLLFLIVYSILVQCVSPLLTGAVPLTGDILLALLSGGTLFTALFLLQWPGTVPYSLQGKIVYGALGGILAFLFCGTGTSPVGAVMTVLFMNICSPTIQLIEGKTLRKNLSRLLAYELGDSEK